MFFARKFISGEMFANINMHILYFVPSTPQGNDLVLVYLQDIYKSGFFYIEGCFYNDFRDGGSQDYSQ